MTCHDISERRKRPECPKRGVSWRVAKRGVDHETDKTPRWTVQAQSSTIVTLIMVHCICSCAFGFVPICLALDEVGDTKRTCTHSHTYGKSGHRREHAIGTSIVVATACNHSENKKIVRCHNPHIAFSVPCFAFACVASYCLTIHVSIAQKDSSIGLMHASAPRDSRPGLLIFSPRGKVMGLLKCIGSLKFESRRGRRGLLGGTCALYQLSRVG